MYNAAQLKTKAEKRVDELLQNISRKMFCWSSISKRDETLDASDQRDSCGCTTSLSVVTC